MTNDQRLSHTIPEQFTRRVLSWQHEDGQTWLDRLPALVQLCEERWEIAVVPAFRNLTFNYVAPATRADSTAAVLKIGFPAWELISEATSLQVFGGDGMVRLLEVDLDNYCMLLERLEPGHSLLRRMGDEQATAIAASVMSQLWKPVPSDAQFRTTRDWTLGMQRHRVRFEGGTGPLPVPIFEHAERLFEELHATEGEAVMLHGDLHQDNILAASRQPWLAIDPKGITGEPAYETGSWLRNWLPDLLHEPDPRRIETRRINQFADLLGFDCRRIRDWAIAQAVLSAVWTVEDNGDDWGNAIAVAEILAEIRF